jgi:hypothetical protein
LIHMKKASKLTSPSHPVYYSYLKITSIHHSLETTRSNALQYVTDVTPDHEVRVRCYIWEHIHMLQTMFGHMFGIGPRQKPPERGDSNHACQSICDGTRVNLIIHLLQKSQYGKPISGWSRIGIEQASYIYGFNNKQLCLKVKYASPFMQVAKLDGHIPSHWLGNMRLPRQNQYFSRHGVSMKVLSYEDGAFVSGAPTSDLVEVNLIDLDKFMSYLRTPRVIN